MALFQPGNGLGFLCLLLLVSVSIAGADGEKKGSEGEKKRGGLKDFWQNLVGRAKTVRGRHELHREMMEEGVSVLNVVGQRL